MLKGSRTAKSGNEEAEILHKTNENRNDMYKVNTGAPKFAV